MLAISRSAPYRIPTARYPQHYPPDYRSTCVTGDRIHCFTTFQVVEVRFQFFREESTSCERKGDFDRHAYLYWF